MKEIDNVLRIFKEVREAIEHDNTNKIKQLSNQTIHTATIAQDPENITVAVLIYSIGKILERDHYRGLPGFKEFYASLKKRIDEAIKALENQDIKKFRLQERRIRTDIEKIDSNLSRYIKDVFEKASINKASKIYEHGLSLEQTASLLGVNLWDLSQYIGQSSISEAHINESLPIKQRIKTTEEFFS